MTDKAIRAAKLTLGAVLDKRRAQTAKDRAGGQIAPSKYLPGVPRQFHADGGVVKSTAMAFDDLHPETQMDIMSHLAENIPELSEETAGGSRPEWLSPHMKDLTDPLMVNKRMAPIGSIEGYNRKPSDLAVARYAGMLSTSEAPPILVDGNQFVDGGHRYAAYKVAGRKSIPVVDIGPLLRMNWSSWLDGDTDDTHPVKSRLHKADGGSVADNENFQNWFGNSVTHTNGDPHVFYTGTSKDKDFTSHNVGRHGAWFVRDPVEASSYAEQNDSQGYKRDGWNMVKTNTASRVIPAYVKAENPYTGELPEEYLRDNYKAAQSDWFDTLRAKGHDAWMPASQNGNLIVALKEPQQIKSIFNNGKFDPKQKHMNKAEGGRIAANKGGSMGARADFLAGNHPEVPNVVYHSTKADFHQFNPMSHFGTRQSAHDRYSPDAQLNENMSIIPAHISLKNPLDVGLENNWQNNQQTIRQAADVMFKSENPSREYLQAAEKLYDLAHNPFIKMPEVERRGAEILREAGHDGIIYTNNIEDPGSRSFVTLGPEQVKSSIGNQGTFDPAEPDMTKADGGSVDDEDEGIDAYHGSPHDFDEFDIAHLGTGEGVQAYGHGLYFAGNEGIAKHYKNVLSTRNKVHPDDEAVQKFLPHSAEIQRRKAALSGTDDLISLDTGSDELDAIGADEEKLHRMMIADTVRRKPHLQYGRMYKVKLNVKPHELLDWDKPLSEQPEVARRLGYADPEEIKRQKDLHYSKFKPRGGNSYEDLFGPLDPEESAAAEALSKMPEGWGNMTGKALHDRLVARTGSKKGAADAMLAAGLKGIRYLDAGSRDISDGDPTHNYVMFHHDPVKVVDKYEYGGAVGKSEGGSMGDDEIRPVDLGVTRALRRFNQNGDGPTPEAEGVFNRLAAAQDAADEAHDAARKAGAFDSAQIGDVFKYKPLDTYAPMKVVGHGMVHVSRWGGINPPKYVFNDHFPVAHVEYQDASKERQRFPVELLEDRSRYDFISGKPRIARADGGRLDLYSKAARIIRGMKDQKMDVADILKYATGKGAKKTEIAHVDVPPGKATPSQVAEHIEFMQPQVGVHKRETFYRYNDPERYERQINYLEGQGRYDEAEELNREFEAFEGYGGKDAPIYAKYQLPGGENYREHVLTLDSHPDDQTYTAPIHWGKMKNPLAHIRMSTRMIGNKKILHIEEMQSDWNNDARKSGFRTGREKQDYDDYVAKMREDAINGIDQNASPMIRDALRQKYSAMDPYMLALKMGRQPEHASLANSAFMGSKLPPRAPYINPEKDDVYEMAMKHVLMEAAKGGYDGIAFTPDEEQELRWPGHTFKGIYNKRLPGIAQRLVQPHDLDTDTDDMTRLNGWAVPMIPLSDKARDSITQNGFSSFRRGGSVDAALAATRRFTRDGQHVTMRLKD